MREGLGYVQLEGRVPYAHVRTKARSKDSTYECKP